MLILDIFAQRAAPARASSRWNWPSSGNCCPSWPVLATSSPGRGGGIGTRGPGETKLETDRRHIRARIHALEERLEA